MQKISRFFIIGFLVFLLASTFVYAGGTAEGSAEKTESGKKVTMTYWYPWGGDSETWDKWRMSEFEKANPDITVNGVYVPPDGGLSNGKLLAAIAGGTPPDVVVSNTAALSYALATQGALAPLDEPLKKAGFKESDLLPPFLDLMKYKGTTYIFPHDSNVSLFYYNVDMFREAGLDPDKPPKTIEELDAYAEKLSQVQGGSIERLGFIPWIDGPNEDKFLWGWIFGGNFYNAEENRLTVATPQMAAVYNWMKGYAQRYNPERIQSFTSGFGGAFSPDHPFFNGKVAMTVNGNWFTNAIRIYAPDLNYRVAPIPAPPDGRQEATVFGTNVFLVPRGAKQIDAAVKFMLFASQPEISADNINTWRSISVWKKESPAVKWYENDDPIYKMILDIANNPESGHPALTKVATQLSDELTLVRDAVIYKGADPMPLLKAVEDKLQKELDK